MRLAILDHAEAADSAVMSNIARYLLSGTPITIAHADRPDVGQAPVGPIPTPVSAGAPKGETLDPAQCFVAAAASSIVPAAIIPPTPPAASAPAVPPAPEAIVPAAPAAPPAAAPSVDTKGLPWDERIHTSTKTFNKDGTWRQKRETAPELVSAVEAELRAKMGLPTPVPPAPPAAVPPAPQAAASVFATATQAAVDAGAQAAPNTFGELMLWVTPYMTAGKLSNTGLQEVLNLYGVAKLPELITKPDLVPAIYAHLAASLA